jgi:hypothetical protein
MTRKISRHHLWGIPGKKKLDFEIFTANEYMQELPESVGRMVESMCEELMHGQSAVSADLLPNATNEDGSTAMCMKEMVGTRRLELLTSTVSRSCSTVTD